MSYSNRGMAFENLLNHSNDTYRRKDIAIVNKRPTPIRVIQQAGSKIVGFFERPSTVDYDGTYKGRPIVFEAKATRELARFPLSNIEEHQVKYLQDQARHGAIAFLLIVFEKINQNTYLVPVSVLTHYWDRRSNKHGTASIPLNEIEVYGYRVDAGRVPVDYLKAVDKVWGLWRSWKRRGPRWSMLA